MSYWYNWSPICTSTGLKFNCWDGYDSMWTDDVTLESIQMWRDDLQKQLNRANLLEALIKSYSRDDIDKIARYFFWRQMLDQVTDHDRESPQCSGFWRDPLHGTNVKTWADIAYQVYRRRHLREDMPEDESLQNAFYDVIGQEPFKKGVTIEGLVVDNTVEGGKNEGWGCQNLLP